MISNHLTQSDVAQKAGISRAAVTKWFQHGQQKGWINVETSTLRDLAQSLKIPPEVFLKERQDISSQETRFLWDRLYPNMEFFIQALVQMRCPALARLVQVLGFRNSMTIVGKKAIQKFNDYKKFIKPIRRKQLEILWPLYASKI